MRLSDLFDEFTGFETAVSGDLEIRAIAYDSRKVGPGTLFFAIAGQQADGYRFVPQAFERGAAAVVSERPAPSERPDYAGRWVQVPRIRRALSEAGRAFYGHPERRLRLVGITGTNGKTTTAYLAASILRAAGLESGLFGTIEYRVAGKVLPALNTTPESLDLVQHFDTLVRAGGSAAVMEVSSHALAQERIWGFPFAVAVFTNLTRDHLDYHGVMEDYFRAKRKLFEGLGAAPPGVAVIGIDDPWAVRLTELPFDRLLTFGVASDSHIRPRRSSQSASGLKASFATPAGTLEVNSRLVGSHNLLNIMAAAGVGIGLGIELRAIKNGIEALDNVPGRFERVQCGQPFLVVVDYAHTDDALRNVLKLARELTRSRLIVVFGCGGDRDRAKRPLMGEAAGSLADLVVLTSDNPRSEDPFAIINDALVGLQTTGTQFILEVDRAAAIEQAIGEAQEGDTVVLAGKGHETYQVFADRTIPFDDRVTARAALARLGYAGEAAEPNRR